MQNIRWGIVGTGTIAHRFANAVSKAEGAVLAAVASRKQETADCFGNEFNIPLRFASYEAMAASGEIDAAYIAVPHGCHKDASLLFLNINIAVLCEKPLAVNAREVEELTAAAHENHTFLMEAMWARLVPGTLQMLQIVKSGKLGSIMGVRGSFCYDMSDERDHHVFSPANGGGSLLDVGVYGLHFASWYIDAPVTDILAAAHIENGTDSHCCALLRYENGAIAEVNSASLLREPNEGFVFGTKGYARLPRFYAPQKITLCIEGQPDECIDAPYAGNGFEEQIEHVGECLRAGKTESDILPLSKTLFITRQMDEIRAKTGLRYPQD